MNEVFARVRHAVDVCVVGGGMAGLTAAVSAARQGVKALLMQDRPVLGGNASSEVRMWIRGAAGRENRETGLLMELELENIYRNPAMNYTLWDSVLTQAVLQEENLTVLMNCSCLDLEMDESRVVSVEGWQLTTYTAHIVYAKVFVDCSGDSILAPLAGAPYRVGREGCASYEEYAAPEAPDRKTMGNSCLIEARETDHPCPFIPPPWANVYPTDESMHGKNHDFIGTGVNFWWIELGGEEDTILDAESIREALLKVAFGVWDHIKNHGDHGAERWELEWIGFLPGKRESRRYMGDYTLTQRDLEEGTDFDDVVAFGGWTMDNHAPEGFRYPGYSSRHIKPAVPYGIPYRSLYSADTENLMFAGRNISATHMALSSTRVMATCSVIGQAVGTAAAMAAAEGLSPRQVGATRIRALQRRLLEDGCMLPGRLRPLPEAMAGARLSITGANSEISRHMGIPQESLPRGGANSKISRHMGIPQESLPRGGANSEISRHTGIPDGIPDTADEAVATLQNGWERPHGGAENRVLLAPGEAITIDLRKPVEDGVLRVALDPDFSRESISPMEKYRAFAMRTHIFRDEPPLVMPAPLARRITVIRTAADGLESVTEIRENRRALVFVPLAGSTVRVTVRFEEAWGKGETGVFACDVGGKTLG